MRKYRFPSAAIESADAKPTGVANPGASDLRGSSPGGSGLRGPHPGPDENASGIPVSGGDRKQDAARPGGTYGTAPEGGAFGLRGEKVAALAGALGRRGPGGARAGRSLCQVHSVMRSNTETR